MPQRSPIVSPETLHARLGAPDLRLVDVRWVMGSPGAGRLGYEVGHIPGAIFLDLDTDLAAATGPGRHPLPEPADLGERLEAVGIGDADDVVVYDDVGGWIAARLWWMLDDLGHQRVRVLDGGLPAWLAAGFPTTTAEPGPRPRGRLHLHDRWTNVIDRERVVAGLGRLVLLDARGAAALPRRGRADRSRPRPHPDREERAGRRQRRAGSTAAFAGRSWPSGSMRSVSPPTSPVVTSCGSGVTACFTSLAMRVAGLPDPILYPGSYSDWSRAGLPVAIGPEPGEPPAGQPTSG